MKIVIGTVAVSAALAFSVGTAIGGRVPPSSRPIPHSPTPKVGSRGISTAALSTVVQRYCSSCHNPTTLKGNLSLAGYDVDSATTTLAASEKIIRKLRADMMPPPGSRRPAGDTLVALAETL